MPFSNQGPNQPLGTVNNPTVQSVFVRNFEEEGFPIPPSSEYIISEQGSFCVTESGDRMITE